MPDLPASPAADARDRETRILLAAFHAAREAGDEATAKRHWQRIVAGEWSRVELIVSGFQTGPAVDGNRIPASERETVVSDVFLRLHGKVHSLRRKSVGELRAFLRTATGFACKDWVRRHVREDVHHAGSIDAEHESLQRADDAQLAQLAVDLSAETDDAILLREVIHPAFALIDPDKRPAVIHFLAGAPVEETMRAQGIKRDLVYQRRKRGLKELREAIAELAGEDAF